MKFRALASALALGLSLGCAPALADTAVGAGVFFPSGGGTTGGVLGSLSLGSLPVAPVNIQLSGAIPFGSGRYAVTAEGVFHAAGFFAGAGAGVGRFRQNNGVTGGLYDILAGVRVAPSITLNARYYGSGSGNVGSATYAGLLFRLK